jgi:osmotically-inducible protein OsmY
VFRKLLAEEGISIEVSNGMVTLRGTVDTPVQRELAEEAVAALHGVRSIDNQIALKPVPQEDADALLARTVKAVLAWHCSARGATAKLEVKEGVVILRGEAESDASRSLAAEYAAGIEGVRSVKNELVAKHAGQGEAAPKQQEDCGPEPLSPTEATAGVDDPSVAAQARMALRLHRPTRSLKPGLEVSEGLLTLTGIAPTEEERQLAGRLCADIHGVRKVLNKMTLEPEQTQN